MTGRPRKRPSPMIDPAEARLVVSAMLIERTAENARDPALRRFLADVVKACRPVDATLTGEFTPRGGVFTKITASWSKGRRGRKD